MERNGRSSQTTMLPPEKGSCIELARTSSSVTSFPKPTVPIGDIRTSFASETPAQIVARRQSMRGKNGVPVTSPHSISTPNILRNFDTVDEDSEAYVAEQKWRDAETQAYRRRRAKQRDVLQQLKQQAKGSQRPLWRRILKSINMDRSSDQVVDKNEVYEIAREMFPPRLTQRIFVCDFYAQKAISYESTIGEIELIWKSKPKDVVVRWIHAPVGKGLVHSSIEDMFVHDGEPGKRFRNGVATVSRFLEIDQMTFVKSSDFEDRRIAFKYISEDEEVSQRLNPLMLKGDRNLTLLQDLQWRAKFLRVGALSYWNTAGPDQLYQILESPSNTLESSGGAPNFRPDSLEPTSLHTLGFFEDAHLAFAPFRCYHREDGCLLTLSAAYGVDYIDNKFSERLARPPSLLQTDPEATVIGHAMERFKESGTSEWSRHTVEWLLEYLVTEIGVTPHNMRGGGSGWSVAYAFLKIVRNLSHEKYHKWQPKKSVELVRAYLLCIDELSALQKLFARRLDIFKCLEKDISIREEEDVAAGRRQDNPAGEQSLDRVRWAMQIAKRELAEISQLHEEMKLALNALFQIRSIEQNDLSLMADGNNKAIVIFTMVTIVFLPLSFFTSYYGMNIQGLSNNSLTETQFWTIYGPTTLIIVAFVILYAFRQQMLRLVRRDDLRLVEMHMA